MRFLLEMGFHTVGLRAWSLLGNCDGDLRGWKQHFQPYRNNQVLSVKLFCWSSEWAPREAPSLPCFFLCWTGVLNLSNSTVCGSCVEMDCDLCISTALGEPGLQGPEQGWEGNLLWFLISVYSLLYPLNFSSPTPETPQIQLGVDTEAWPGPGVASLYSPPPFPWWLVLLKHLPLTPVGVDKLHNVLELGWRHFHSKKVTHQLSDV